AFEPSVSIPRYRISTRFPYTALFRSPNVAEVIHNRLSGACAEHGVPDSLLQMDSTVHYAIGEFGDVFTTREQRRTDSPYNTYRRSEEHTSELQSRENSVCRPLIEQTN